MAFFILWWTFDDHLAAALGMPGVGHLPFWVMFLLGLSLEITSYQGSS